MSLEALQPHRKSVSYCSACPKMCRFSCPVAQATGNESDTPTAKALVVQQVMAGRLELTAATANTFYRCSECLHSRTHCEHKIEVADHFQAARVAATAAGVEPPKVRRVDQSIRLKGNPFGADLLAAVADLVPPARRNARAAVAYFPGCVALVREPGIVRATVRLLEALGVDFAVYAGADSCTGYPALSGGYPDTFRLQARRQRDGLDRYGTVITSCPACAHTLERRYPEHGFPLRGKVAHVTEFLTDHLSRLRRSPRAPADAVYHDPCFLGRYRRTTEPPRTLLGIGLGGAAREFARHRRDANCCGAGGLLPQSHPTIARAIARARLAEADAAGGRTIVTACPSCVRWLKTTDPARAVRDVVEVLAEGV